MRSDILRTSKTLPAKLATYHLRTSMLRIPVSASPAFSAKQKLIFTFAAVGYSSSCALSWHYGLTFFASSYVTFPDRRDADYALDRLDRTDLHGSKVYLDEVVSCSPKRHGNID